MSGEKTFPEGKYEGELKGGKREGNGKMVYTWGGIYEGAYKNDKREGFGKMKYPGAVYEGEWKNDERSGKGTNMWKNGRRYEGQFANDEIDGEGRWRWSDGRSFHGRFKKDSPLEGCLVESDGSVYKVTFDGKTDIADDGLKPKTKVKLPDPQGENFAAAAKVWENCIQAAASIGPLREKTDLAEALAKATEKEAADATKKLEEAEVKHSEASKRDEDAGRIFKDLDEAAAADKIRKEHDAAASAHKSASGDVAKSQTELEEAEKRLIDAESELKGFSSG